MSRGENVLKSLYLKKTILLLEAEIELLKLLISQTKLNSLQKSDLEKANQIYFIPRPDGLGLIGMAEFALSLNLTDEFFDETGKPAPLNQIASKLENAFHFSFGNIYKKQDKIFNRKSYNLTKALDYLRNLLIRKDRKIKMKKD